MAQIWMLIWMVQLMTRTKSFEAPVKPDSFTPTSQSNVISHLTPQSRRNWSPSMAIDRVGVWTRARAEYRRRVGGKICAWLSPFVVRIDDLPPWDRLAQSGQAEHSMRSRCVMQVYMCLSSLLFLVFYVNLNLWVPALYLCEMKIWVFRLGMWKTKSPMRVSVVLEELCCKLHSNGGFVEKE